MRDDSIDTVISHFDMGYLVTLVPTGFAQGVELERDTADQKALVLGDGGVGGVDVAVAG
jgi:hypothetical protein